MEKFKRSIALSLILTLVLTLLPINVVIGDVTREDNKIHMKSTYPKNNDEGVEINPLIKFEFNQKVELTNDYKQKIKISSDGDEFAVDLNKDTIISFEENTLKIDINSLDRAGKFNLRKNTAYKVTLEKGTLRLKNNKDVVNDKINLYFITGTKKVPANEGLVVEKYSSNIEGTDKINEIDSTQLDVDGTIYLHFNKNIQWNKYNQGITKDEQALKYFKLYRRPKEYERDKSYLYDLSKKSIGTINREVTVENVEIIKDAEGKNTNVLKIKPKEKLLNLNEYSLQITKRDILISFEDDTFVSFEDNDLKVMEKSIWTKASDDKTMPVWDRKASAEEIIEYKKAPEYDIDKNKEYVINGAPRYDKDTPITIHVDKEVVLKLYSDNISPLSHIKLYETYGYSKETENLKNIDIDKYKIEYYMDKGVKKTKLLFYPKDQLEAGKEYKLDVKQGTFVTRGNMPVEVINLRFVIEGDHEEETGIYGVNILVDGEVKQEEIETEYITETAEGTQTEVKKEIVKNIIFDDFLYFYMDEYGNIDKNKRSHKVGFELEGYNFSEDIESIQLIKVKDYFPDPDDEGEFNAYWKSVSEEFGRDEKPTRDPQESKDLRYPKTISLSKEKVSFVSVNKIKGEFDEKALLDLSQASSLGEYEVEVTFKTPEKISKMLKSAKSKGMKGKVSIKNRPCKGVPNITSKYPSKGSSNVNHTRLEKIRIDFEDTHSDVVSKLRGGSGIGATNKVSGFKLIELDANGDPVRDDLILIKDNGNMDIKSIQKGGTEKITFEIAIDSSKLKEGTTYEVRIPADIVRCKHDYPVHPNEAKTWRFTTLDLSKLSKIYEGSVPENYDADYPIMIGGEKLKDGLQVIFKNMNTGENHYTEKNPKFISGEVGGVLLVYLPNNKKLPVGLYNIVIISDAGLEYPYEHGVFSVVENGKYVPNEIYRMKDTFIDGREIEGSLKEIIKTSKNELELSSRYTNETLNLDSIIGEEVLTRDIKYDGSSISSLDTKSKWVNVKLTGIRSRVSNKPMTIRLGRAEALVLDNLKKRLIGENIKSEFIIVGGENYSAQKLNLTIPYKQSNGKNLKVLRYDEESRKISTIKLYDKDIDKKDKLVKIELVNALSSDNVIKGIFVVVE